MAKSAMIRARVEPDLKAETESIFSQMGLSPTEAITLFYQQVRLAGGLPFEVRTPNQTTRQTLQKTDEGQELVRCQDAAEMFERLGL